MKASYSKINSFQFCPKKYEYRYVLNTPAPRRVELGFGTALHAALEHNFEQKIETRKDLPIDDVAQAFRGAFDRETENAAEESLSGPTGYQYLRSLGEHFVEIFMKQRAPLLQPAPRGVECSFTLPLPGGHLITGQFDLMDEAGVLHDFKTSNKRYDPASADKTQLVLYAWACRRLFNRYPSALCFDVFVKAKEMGSAEFVGLQEPVMFETPPPEEMARVAGNLAREIERVAGYENRNEFPWAFEPVRCHWCEYQDTCVDDWRKWDEPRPVRLPRPAIA